MSIQVLRCQKQSLDGYPPPLADILSESLRSVNRLYDLLLAGDITPVEWHDQMERIIGRYHLRAFVVGRGGELTAADRNLLARQIAEQYNYLERFTQVLATARAANIALDGFRARAEMYAVAPKSQYWRGYARANGFPPAPAYPGEDSQCLTNCKCRIDWETLDGNGNYNMYWRLGQTAHDRHCQTCLERAKSWNPLRYRNGRMLLPSLRYASDTLEDEIA